jgi:hypothetical protein
MARKDKKDENGLTLLEKVQTICLKEGCPEPDEFLAAVMTGVDPRFDASPLYHLVSELSKKFGDSAPKDRDWRELRDLVLLNPAYQPVRVDQKTSMKAAERLMDHLYPKLKAVEVTGEQSVRTVQPLTESELTQYKKNLDDEY